MRDDTKQASAAAKILKTASLIAVSIPCLCEFVWVLRRVYSFDGESISAAIRALLDTRNVIMNRPAVEAGLALLEAGGDFADGAMAYEGTWLGGESFVSFDKQAVELLAEQGVATQLLK
ncbi:MAG: type II toxin-antitoxin system VapC family toxin [Oxalobacteraceae bacterium]|nr:type II toxin-antitoxin system VapC family toxin [Oxalobacteraceae bacterium]